jgi:Holliday junction resolvasome RuvABC endonuclease subunit
MIKYVLGVDAGFAHTGLSLFRIDTDNSKVFDFIDCKTIKTEKIGKKKQIRVADDDAERIAIIVEGIDDFLKPYFYKVSSDGIDSWSVKNLYAAVELPHGGARGARPNRTMGIITGLIVSYFKLRNIPIEYIAPNDVKLVLSGKRSASKDFIMKKIRAVLEKNLDKDVIDKLPKAKGDFEHIADSIGVVAHIRKFSQMYKVFSNS